MLRIGVRRRSAQSQDDKHCENENMRKLSQILAIAGMAFLGYAASGLAQVQQSINFTFTVYDQTDSGVRTVRLGTKDVIENLAGAKVPGGKLWLVMPTDPSVDGNG